MGKRKKGERISALTVLIDETTYVDEHSHAPLKCVITITEPQTGNLQCLPRVHLPERIMQSGPQTMAEYVREELSRNIGFPIDGPLTFKESVSTAGNRTLLVFAGTVRFTATGDSSYLSVTARCASELLFLLEHDRITKLHYKIARRFIDPR